MNGPTERHHEVEFVRVLEGELQRNDERVVDQGEDRPLSEDMGDFAWSRRDVGLADGFERVYTLCVLLPDLHHLPERTLSDDLEQVERLDRQRLGARRLEVDLEMEGARAGGRGVPLVGGVVSVELGRQVDAAHEDVVPHVILALHGRRAQVGRHRDVRRARDIAAGSPSAATRAQHRATHKSAR